MCLSCVHDHWESTKGYEKKPSRRGQMLLAYLPVTRLEHVTNQSARRRMLANLFHACMSRVLEPLKTAGVDGVLMASGDRVVRRAHPILATFIGDYPEQVLVCCCKTGECPKCIVERNEIGCYRPTLIFPDFSLFFLTF
jgi:hypothetical protein